LTRLKVETTGDWNLCNGMIMKMDYVKMFIKENRFYIFFLARDKNTWWLLYWFDL